MRAVQTCAAAVLLAVTASALPTSGSATRPPSSTEPAADHERVRVSHRHQRVAACVVNQGSGPKCRPVLEEGDTATSLTFTPASRLLSSVSAQRPVRVKFEKSLGVQEQEIELALGTWTVAWPGAPHLTRIDVGARGTLAIALTTVSGRCELSSARCARADSMSRRITVHRAE